MPKKQETVELRDVQSQPAEHPVVIHKVGVRSVPFPLVVMDKEHEVQHTVALINMYVDLPKQFRGTHMSRFIEILNEYRGVFVVRNIYAILKDIKKRLKAESAHLEASFSYFMNRKAPVSGSAGLMEFRCQFIASLNGEGRRDFVLV
ncbi:MAG TPA: GTP cyclohydrolase, FolE2/MptA family, partial [bacterium]|nr:GTP cyclohydrolase, FolE2/MptA family [bacterium]